MKKNTRLLLYLYVTFANVQTESAFAEFAFTVLCFVTAEKEENPP